MSIDALLAWAVSRGAYVEPIEIRTAADGNRSVFARRDVAPGEPVLKVPRALVIATSDALESPVGIAMRDFASTLFSRYMPLAAWVGLERHERDSPWLPFLRSMPTTFPAWTPEVMAALEGTRAGELIRQRARLLENDRAFMAAMNESLAAIPAEDLEWGLCITRSRCYQIGENGEEALVPVADMFDHDLAGAAEWSYRADEAVFEIRATRAVAAGDEIRISYGPHDNAQWLAGYGFAVEDNPDDEVVLRFAPDGPPVYVGTLFDARFRKALGAARDAAGDDRATFRVLREAALQGRERIAGGDVGQAFERARTCAIVRASERAILDEIAAFATRAEALTARTPDEQRTLAEAIPIAAVGADRLLRGFLLATSRSA